MKSIFQSVAVGLLILVVVIALMNSFASAKVPTSMEHLQNATCVSVPPGKQVQFVDVASAPPVAAPAAEPSGPPPATPVSNAAEVAPANGNGNGGNSIAKYLKQIDACKKKAGGNAAQIAACQRNGMEDCYLDCINPPADVRKNVLADCRNMEGQKMLACLNQHGVQITDKLRDKCTYCSPLQENFHDYDPLTLDYAPAVEQNRILCTGNVQGPGPTQHGPGLREPFWCPRREKTFMTESLDPYGYCCGKFYSNMSQGYQQCVASGAGVNPPPPGR